LDWNSLKIFLSIAETGTLMGAAQQLSLSNSTIFRRLNAFEEEVGSRLFERINGDYELTETGEEMLVLAKQISHSFEGIERHIIGKDILPQGTVKITAPSSFAHNFLPRHLIEFKKLYPDIKIELLVSNLELNMSGRQADIALRITPSPPDHLIGRKIRNIKWGIYASECYLEKFGHPISITDLSDHQLIGAAGTLRTNPAFFWLDKKYSKNIEMRSDDFTTISHLTEAGFGLTCLPDELKRPNLKRLFTYEAGGENTLWILTHPDLRKVERIKLVMKYLATVISTDKELD